MRGRPCANTMGWHGRRAPSARRPGSVAQKLINRRVRRISHLRLCNFRWCVQLLTCPLRRRNDPSSTDDRSEEHTSELQSRQYLVCRLLLEKKKKNNQYTR